MKKEYVKPYLAFESFQLGAALAGSCGGSNQFALNHSIDGCDAVEEGGGVFFGAACPKNIFSYEGVSKDGVCYQGPVEGGLYLTS